MAVRGVYPTAFRFRVRRYFRLKGELTMTAREMLVRACVGVGVMIAGSTAYAGPAAGGIEPNAGNWRTWVISSGRDYRVPPPPGPAETRAELRTMAGLISHNDASTAAS